MNVSRHSPCLETLFGPVLLLTVTAGLSAVLWAVNGPVRVVQVSGDLTVAERREVREAVVTALEGSYFSQDLDAVVDRVRALSWPHGVAVRRTFPDGVRVAVTKEVFVARWGGGGVLNSEGAVIKTPEFDVRGLPLLDCAMSGGARAMQVYQTVAGVLAGRDVHVATLRENAIGEWLLELDSELTVALGSDDLLARLERFLVVYDGALASRVSDVASVDARYPNGVAVSWHETDASAGSVQLAALDGALTVDH